MGQKGRKQPGVRNANPDPLPLGRILADGLG